jgi:DNA-binding GntR family transcriptional regulator
VYQAIRQDIVSLKLRPGAVVSENDLSAALGVSRTPIREALVLLVEEGLVQVFPRVGSFVSRVDPQRIAEAQFLRHAVEMASLRSLTPPLDDRVLSDLSDNLDAQARVGTDVEGFFALDEQFHQGLMALAGHEGSWATVAAAKGHLDRARMLTLMTRSDMAQLTGDHQAIFAAITAGDLDAAATTLHSHLSKVFADIQAIETASPELFESDPDTTPVRRSIVVWE